MDGFISGALTLGYFLIGVYFFRFWRDTRDRLFALFGVAFWILAIQRMAIVFVMNKGDAEQTWIYIIRLSAYILILYAIVDKNRAESTSSQ